MNNLVGKEILHYDIIEEIGRGGMGVVYKALDKRLERTVAIKFLPPQVNTSDEERERFKTEARAAAALNHPNIATIHAIEEHDDEIFIVMEYIEGRELKELLIDNSQLSIDNCLDYVTQIANGLQAAHEKGIVHRDIKSRNIMLTKVGQVKIMDFGLAKVKSSTGFTKIGTTLGTAAYMSPEQSEGSQVDQRSDLWSLGILFHEILTGEFPFKGDYEQAIIYSILNEKPRLSDELTLPVKKILEKLLEKDPENRLQTCGELLKALQQIRKGDGTDKNEENKTIAVLPFENISPDNETDYFADGLAEELIINLSKVNGVNVVARTNSMQYKGTKKDVATIGRELGARYIMEGSVRKFQDNLRISVQLIDVESSTQLWGETYKGKLADVFDIQENVSREIVEALRLKLSPIEKVVLEKRATLNPEAFDLNLRARDFLYKITRKNIQFAIQLFQKAIELDIRYAAPYAGLGEAYAYLYFNFERNREFLDKAIESGMKALMYDATYPEAYAALALAYYNKNELEDALAAGKKSIELDPNNFLGYWILGRIYHSTDRDKEAIELFNKVIALNPDFYTAYSDLRMCYEKLSDKEKQKSILEKTLSFFPKYLSQHPDDSRAHMFFAVTLADAGKIEEAKQKGARALELSPDDTLMLYNGACFYALLNEKELALQSLEKAISAGWENYEWMKRDTDLDNIRQESKFVELIKGK